ncbi:MAG: tetraacyldisaccharide 4'-kinase, partial [Legionellales bacterium]
MSLFVDRIWYKSHPLQWILRPFSWIYRLSISIRRWYLQRFCQKNFAVPIVVVGNLTVGGVGKTPLVIALANKFSEKGLKVGIVSRGYGAQITQYPHEVSLKDSALEVGDEPLLIAQKTNCPVVIAPKRTEAVNYLLEKHQSQIIISDDGLQHYRMGRAIELLVIDGIRGLGNGLCLPAGPLREPEKRLRQVDFIIVNEGIWDKAYSMTLKPGLPLSLDTDEAVAVESFTDPVAAVAAIGNPQRFYATLSQLGIKFNEYSYPDHYQFTPDDLNYSESKVIMTEKDAVKCRLIDSNKLYCLPVEAVLSEAFWDALWSHQQLQGY